MKLVFEVEKQKIVRTDKNKVVADSRNYLYADFIFKTDEWDNITKTATFEKGANTYNVILENDSCLIPWEVIKEGKLRVSVFGGDLITTDMAEVTIYESGYKEGEAPKDPTPDIYQQIIDKMDHLQAGEVTDEQIVKAVNDYLKEHPVSGVNKDEVEAVVSEYVAANADKFKGEKGDPGESGSEGLPGADGKSAYDIAIKHGFDGTEEEWLESLKGKDGADGNGEAVDESVIEDAINAYLEENPVSENPFADNYRFKYVPGILHRGSLYSHTQKQMRDTGVNYACVEYELDGSETHIRFTGATSGGSDRVAWCFVDENNEVLKKADFVSGESFENVVVEIPEGASKVYINGNNKRSAHLEVRISDLMADKGWLNQLLSVFGKRISYNETFAWKEMPTGHFAFTFDDSLDDIASTVDLFESLGVPCCFGAIPERLNEGITSTETVGEVMLRAIKNGGEVLAHGDGCGIVTEKYIDDENHLYKKFVCNMQKFYDYGIDVRGVLRVGGSDSDGNLNICKDERTDKWVRLFYDYGDLYGLKEPYNHERITMSTTSEGMKAQIDEAIAQKKFCSFIFHEAANLHDIITEAVQYIQAQGGVVCTYAYVYDTYGSTAEEQAIEKRLKALENNVVEDGNGVSY